MHAGATDRPGVEWRLALWVFAVAAGLALISLWLSGQPGSVAALWLPNVFGALLLHRQPRLSWPGLLACHLGGAGLAGWLYGDPLRLLALYQAINGAEVLLGAALLGAFGPSPSLPMRWAATRWWRQALLAVLLPSALGAALSAVLLAPVLQLPPGEMALRWFASVSTGGFTLLALAAALGDRSAMDNRAPRATVWRRDSGWREWAGVPAAALLALLVVHAEPFRFVYVGTLALAVALLLPLRPALAALTLVSLVLGWGIATGLAQMDGTMRPDRLTAYASHLLSILPAIWVSLERAQARWEHQTAVAAFEASADGLLLLNDAGQVVKANGAAATWLGWTRERLVGQPMDALLPELRPQLQAGVTRAPDIWVPIVRTPSAGGRFEAEARLHRFAEGRDAGPWMVSLRDLTQRRQEEQVLRQALERLERFSRVTPGVLATFRLAPDGSASLPWQSAQAEALWGVSSDLLARDAAPLFARVAPEALTKLLANIQASAQSMSVFRSEFEYRAGEGPLKWIAIESMPVREPDGAVVWFGLCRDITEHRREALAQREAELRWAMAADAGGVGIWTLDVPSSSMVANSRFYAILGQTPAGDAWPLASFVALIDPQTPWVWLQDDGASAREPPSAMTAQVLRVRGGESGWIWVEVRVQAVDAALSGGAPLRLTGTLIDISDRVEAERIRAAQANAEAANVAKSRFVSRMSHELRTPLNAVLGFAELLEEDTTNSMTETQRQYVKEVIRAAEWLLTLVDDVLDLAQIESREMVLSLAPLRLAPLLDEVATAMMPMARRHQVRLVPPKADPSWVVVADRRRMVQVLLNLVSNGIKYNCEEGSVRLDAELATDPSGVKRCWVHVQDSGRGMDEEQLQGLGQPFNRLGAERSGIEGTGIGLSISKHLIASMGCELRVRSVPGEGSTFSVGMPLASKDQPTGPAMLSRPVVHPTGLL